MTSNHPGIPRSPQLVPVDHLVHEQQTTYSDVPGAHEFARDHVAQALLERMTEVHGEAFARTGVDHIRWHIRHPRWPGDETLLTGRVEVSTYTRAD